MEQLENQSTYRCRGINLTEQDRIIASRLGNGNIGDGCRTALAWAAHFYNLGLNTEMLLDNVGLVTVSSTDNHMTD